MTNEEIVREIQQNINVKDNMGELYQQNLPLIKKLVRPYSKYMEEEDLLQEAFFGLEKAVYSYNEEKEVPFMSYAFFILRQFV